MKSPTYAVEAAVEATHWWFVGRRRLFAAELDRAKVTRQAQVLDLGTSTGTNLRMLRDLGYHRVVGLDISLEAIHYCESKGLGPVSQGDVCAIPFADSSFDLVFATDIVEHVDNDELAVAEIARVLRPGGYVLLTVPAFNALWGLQDEVAFHKRRYRLGPLLRKVRGAGLEPERAFYFNYLLCPPIWLVRRLLRVTRVRLASENQLNTRLLNRLLTSIFAYDVSTAPRLRPPFGVSALVLARKSSSPSEGRVGQPARRPSSEPKPTTVPKHFLEYLRCPVSQEPLHLENGALVTRESRKHYRISSTGIPLFAENAISAEGRTQQEHYDRIASAYLKNLTYPHTQEYMAYLDRVFLESVGTASIGSALEICCGRGEALLLLQHLVAHGLGVDVSLTMLEAAQRALADQRFFFIQGDATMLPLGNDQFDAIFMLGGIHHVNDRQTLFSEVHRVLRPGGRFFWREPVSDFLPWRVLRALIYRLSPALDHNTEHPLILAETTPPLERAGLRLLIWRTYGFLGFCLCMNSDILVVNRLLRFVPGIRKISRIMTKVDDIATRIPGLRKAGLQVVGVAEKPGLECRHASDKCANDGAS